MPKTKKTVLFIVEGYSDKEALEKIFKSIYKKDKLIDFKFTSGDVTSDENVTVDNVEEKVYSYVDEYIKDKKLKKKDIFQIIQIFDTDGTYIPANAVEKGNDGELLYTPSKILCKDVSRIRVRNSSKSKMMDYLLSLNSIKGIPYEGYFMSSNLDHALYNEQNLSFELKSEYADAFYEKFMGKEKLFIDFLNSDVVNGVPDEYKKSWAYIREGTRSLERHTNLNVYFKQHPINPLL
jgi:hypothetical protein